MTPKSSEGKRPENLGQTLRTFFSYLGRHKVLVALVVRWAVGE